MIGASQIVGGIGGIGAGAIIRAVLGDRGALGFPYNYALLFGIGGVLFMVSAAFLTLIREPEAEIAPDETPPSPRVVLASMPGVLRRDRPFAVLIATKLLHGFVAMASSFYVLHTTLNLGLDVASAGLFVSAQVVGSLTAGLLMGIVQDRWGPLRHIRLTIIITALPPLLALAGGAFLGTAHLYVLPYYLAVFFLLGISAGSMGWPFFNWILEYAAERDRPIYIGLSNTLSAATMLAPALGGWIAKTVSYPAVFALAVLVALGAWVASSRVPDTRAGTST